LKSQESFTTEGMPDEFTASGHSSQRLSQYQQVVRILTHLTIWVLVLAPVVIEMHRGWRAIQDNATISIRSYQVLSLHPPLLGQLSTLSQNTGHFLYDPGPLQFWFLAIPVHLSPSNGALWGAALLVGLALSLAVEGLWRSGDRWACGIVGLATFGLACLIPAVLAEPSWNPNFGFCFMLACIALAWVVASGSLGWWPWLVALASVSVQSEAFFVFFALGLVVGAPVIGLTVRRPERWRWFDVGIAVGAVCWLPTIIQEATGNQRNLSTILELKDGAAYGISFGLKNLALAGSPSPIWVRGDPALHNWFNYFVLVATQSAIFGIFALLVCLLILVVAWRAGRKRLAAVAALGVILCLATVVTFARTPTAVGKSLWYLDRILWPVGVLLWIIALWTLVEIVRPIAQHRLISVHRDFEPTARRFTTDWFIGILAVCVVALGILAVALPELKTAASFQIDSNQIRLARNIALAVEKATPRGAVSLTINPGKLQWFREYDVVQGAAWQLTADGWQPGLPQAFSASSGITYPPQPFWHKVQVSIVGDTATAHRIS
jgi:hypothetical protein